MRNGLKRGVAERRAKISRDFGALDRLFQLLLIGCEFAQYMSVVVKTHNHPSIPESKQLDKRFCGIFDVAKHGPRTLARVDQYRDGQRLLGRGKKLDLLRRAVLRERKVGSRQIRHITSVAVADNDRNADEPRVDPDRVTRAVLTKNAQNTRDQSQRDGNGNFLKHIG